MSAKPFTVFYKSFMAGVAIAIGATVYLSLTESRIAGACLFAIGLLSIFLYGFNLFTGKVGFAVVRKPIFIAELCIIWIGNLCGTWLVGTILSFTRIYPALHEASAKICSAKLNDSMMSLFCLAIFCGMMMFLAADRYLTATDPVSKHLVVFLPVMVFILSGFEHCVANMYYFTVAECWSLDAFVRLFVMTLGNACGALFLALTQKQLGALK